MSSNFFDGPKNVSLFSKFFQLNSQLDWTWQTVACLYEIKDSIMMSYITIWEYDSLYSLKQLNYSH